MYMSKTEENRLYHLIDLEEDFQHDLDKLEQLFQYEMYQIQHNVREQIGTTLSIHIMWAFHWDKLEETLTLARAKRDYTLEKEYFEHCQGVLDIRGLDRFDLEETNF
jgi:hypothetical protein